MKGGSGDWGLLSPNNYLYKWDINLKMGKKYKLIIDVNGGWCVIPHDLSTDDINTLDQVYFMINQVKKLDGTYYIPGIN